MKLASSFYAYSDSFSFFVFQYEDEGGHDNAGGKKAQPSRLRHTQHEVACRCRACDGQGVRQLRCNVVDVVAMRAGGRQDSGI